MCPYRSWNGGEYPIFFHARCVILTICVDSLSFTRKWLVFGMPSSMLKNQIKNIIKKTPLGMLLVWTVPVDSARRGMWLIGGGGVKTLPFYLGTAYNVSSMESIVSYFVIFVDRKSMPLKIFLSLNLNLELWHLYKSLLPSAKGLSIYFMQFLFLLWVSIFSYKHQLGGTMIVLEHWA